MIAKEYLTTATGHFKSYMVHLLFVGRGEVEVYCRVWHLHLLEEEGGSWLVDCIKVGPGGVSEV